MSRCFIEYDTEPVALLSWQRVKQLQQSRRPTARCVYCWWAWSTWFAVTSSLHYRPTLRQARTWTVLRHQVTWHRRWSSKLSPYFFRSGPTSHRAFLARFQKCADSWNFGLLLVRDSLTRSADGSIFEVFRSFSKSRRKSAIQRSKFVASGRSRNTRSPVTTVG